MNFKKLFYYNQLEQSSLNTILLFTLISSTMVTINSTSWISAWMGMEINLMSFIPLMMMKNKVMKSANLMMTYFMMQASSSCLLMFMVMMFKMETMFVKLNMTNTLIQLSLLMKMGAAPFHWWTPKIIKSMNWKNCFILMTWQKLAPIMLISLTMTSWLIYYSIILSTIIGAIMGLNQTSMKLIMAYSSINHISWMMISLFMNMNVFIFYFFIYMISILIISLMMNNMNINYLNQLFKNNNNNMFNKMNVMLMMLSMGGIPPMIGFLPKFKILMLMMKNQLILESMILIFFSLITLTYYLNPLISTLMTSKMSSKWILMKSNIMKNLFYILMMNFTMTLMMILPMMIM
uniref:NADH-ubiquinone oxidoreductase chain 2 n=1 Tax=Labriocimbex sinicus TaxID=2358206 RepID=A0A4P2UDT4_9HYME|nr:NADH dehydrogenase subunit 2 [Labriocimbex sinicus]AYC21401.1 NADH dehydrogenase subunit 2 [Labriocimbex sinicus]